MKRVSHLFEKIISEDNLKIAIKTVCDSHRWVVFPKKLNPTVVYLEDNIDIKSQELKDILVNGYEPSEVKLKKRYDVNAGKWRNIAEPKIWPDQCVHHALIQVLEPVMMRGMDNWCCGSIKGRGAHYGIRGIKKWMKDTVNVRWCVEMDIYHFYESIKPEQLLKRMKKLIKDYKTLDLIWRIIKDGIQIGAYCSQWFANVLLQELDQLIRNSGAVKMIRYMDNFTVFTKTKESATLIIEVVKKWLEQHELKLKDNWQKFNVDIRMPNALGYRFGRGFTLLRKKSKLRLARCVKRFVKLKNKGKFITAKFAMGVVSRLGMLAHCNSFRFTSKIYFPGLLKSLKNVFRNYYRKEIEKWNMYLASLYLMAQPLSL